MKRNKIKVLKDLIQFNKLTFELILFKVFPICFCFSCDLKLKLNTQNTSNKT